MSAESPRWNSDAASGTVLMEYLGRASPQFVAAELDKLGLLNAADEAAAALLDRVAALRAADVPLSLPRHTRTSLWMVALAMCAMIVVLAETLHVGAMNVLPEDDGTFMQLAGPTPEW
ncbi:MAG TPA: hypothetical protein VJT10_10610 [Steroidobacteraceae bacterium]|nr:hypothetical protein [Steroidobacteraceae bacterium]